MRIHLVPNSHIDPVWLWDKYEGIDEVLNTFRSAADLLDEFPGLTFTASSLQFYQWVRDLEPALFDRIGAFVAADRWEVAGGWWIEADSNLPTGASLVKQAEFAQRFAQQYFGRPITVAYLPDSFGHPATLPQVLAETGFKYFVFCRPNRWEKPDLPADLFLWEHGGHAVLAYRLRQHYLGRRVKPPATRDGPLDLPEYRLSPTNCYFFGVGDHGGGPTREEIQYYNEYIEKFGAGEVGYSSCERFFEEAAAAGPVHPVYSGDLHMHAVGCYSVVRPLKEAVRRSEHGLEFAARALATNDQPADPLDPLWKKVLFNQFHDILPGSCAPHAAGQALAELGGVEDAAQELAYTALKTVGRSRPVRAREGEFRIYNTLPHPIARPLHIESFMYYRPNAAFRDQDGRLITIQEVQPSVRCANRRWVFVDTLPAAGFKSYWFDNDTVVERPSAEAIHYRPGDGVATDRAAVQADGTILVGTEDQRRPLFEYAPRFLVLDDRSDTWGHGMRAYNDVCGAFRLESAAITDGPLAASVYQRWSYNQSRLEAVYTIYAGRPEVYLDLTVFWAERRRILKMEMHPQGKNRPSEFTMQAPGGKIRRKADGAELPLHHWVQIDDWRGDVAIIQDGAFACDCETGRLRITLVRSSIYGYDENTRLDPADPERQTDQGEHRFRLCFLTEPGLDTAKIEEVTAAFLEPCLVIREGYGT
ncbi:hypothetical protein HQ590_05085 [bacterium]|nr:hypothetical protein [bacterium]